MGNFPEKTFGCERVPEELSLDEGITAKCGERRFFDIIN